MRTAVFPGRFESLAGISDFVQQAAREAGLSETGVYAVQTAVDEACSNIIEHAYGGEGIGNITCSVSVDPQGLTIILRDQGHPFDPSRIPDPKLCASLKERKVRGLGLYFIRKMMDEVIFDFDPVKGNQLTLVKRKETPS